jgi:hypothetical protein
MSAAQKPFPQLRRNPGSQGNERPIEILLVKDNPSTPGPPTRWHASRPSASILLFSTHVAPVRHRCPAVRALGT